MVDKAKGLELYSFMQRKGLGWEGLRSILRIPEGALFDYLTGRAELTKAQALAVEQATGDKDFRRRYFRIEAPGDVLWNARRAERLDCVQAARLAGISRRTLLMCEMGYEQMDEAVLARLARVYGDEGLPERYWRGFI